MAGPLFFDRVQETSTTVLTASYVLLGATTGYQAWSVVGNTNTAYYLATDGVNWEVGLGTWATGGTLARTTILSSSNSNAAVSWSAGTRTISLVDPAQFFAGLVNSGTVFSPAVSGAEDLGSAALPWGNLVLSKLADLSNASAGQIKFPATQNPSANANTLDDYSEGTFTPTFSCTGCTFSYATQVGYYIKIGKLVYFRIRIILNTTGNTLAANVLTITGLPYTSGTTTDGSSWGAASMVWTASTSSFVSMQGLVMSNSTSISINVLTAAATSLSGGQGTTVLSATAGTAISVAGYYQAAN